MLERVREWAEEAPEEWDALPTSTQKALVALRVPTDPSETIEGKAGRWGLLAYLGLRLDGFYAHVTSHKRKLKWQNFGRTVPQALLDHESTPGLRDGWVLLAALYHRCVARYTGNRSDETGQNLVNLWSARLLKDVPGPDQNQQWRVNMLKAAGVMMAGRGAGNARARKRTRRPRRVGAADQSVRERLPLQPRGGWSKGRPRGDRRVGQKDAGGGGGRRIRSVPVGWACWGPCGPPLSRR